jgi:UDP-N-acetylmuramate--alanine ligase
MDEFAGAFSNADILLVTEIYPASEQPIPGVSGERLVEAVRAAGHPNVTYVPTKQDLPDRAMPLLQPGDMVLTLGAGDIWKAGMGILDRLPS